MTDIRILGKIEFTRVKHFDRTFCARLTTSGASTYGNGTAVSIDFGTMPTGKTPHPILVDTRYDTRIKREKEAFKNWITQYFFDNYEEHNLTITSIEEITRDDVPGEQLTIFDTINEEHN